MNSNPKEERRDVSCREETEQDREVKEPGRDEEAAAAAEAREAAGEGGAAALAEDRAGTASARPAESECRTASADHVRTSAAPNAVRPWPAHSTGHRRLKLMATQRQQSPEGATADNSMKRTIACKR
jgi:hypothetical protein